MSLVDAACFSIDDATPVRSASMHYGLCCGARAAMFLFVKVEVTREGESQGSVFGARGHERGGYKGLQKYGDTG
jgi:hypothetical protein